MHHAARTTRHLEVLVSTEAAVHPWDEGAIEPSRKAIAVAAALGYFWGGLAAAPLPVGLIIVLFRLGSMTGANTWRGRVRFGRKALLAAAATSVLGFLAHAGLFVLARGGGVSIDFRLGF